MSMPARTVVVVDDNEDQAHLFQDYLSGQGFEVHIALTGMSGLRKVRELQPDIVLLDLVLPDIKGSDVCAQLRANRSTQQIPIILCTAHKISPEEKIKGFRSGADDYLVRPFDLSELLARIEAVLRRTSLHPKADILSGINDVVSKGARAESASVEAPPPVPATPAAPPWTPAPVPSRVKPLLHPHPTALSLLKHAWDLLNHPQKTMKAMNEREEFLLGVLLVFGTPVLESFGKFFQRSAGFDTWIGGFALGLVVHGILWMITAAVLQMALPFLGVHLPFKRALGVAGATWAPRLLNSVFSIVYAGIASVGLASEAGRFSAYGFFDLWSAVIMVAGVRVLAPQSRSKWSMAVIIMGITCFLVGVFSRF